MDIKTTTIRLSRKMLRLAKEAALKEDISLNAWVQAAIHEKLKRTEKEG